MVHTLKSYVAGKWVEGDHVKNVELVDPFTEEPLAYTSTAGIDFAAALQHARDKGGSALRRMSFAERAQMLANMSKALHAHREELLDLSQRNGGNTRSDAKFDIDGATATLSYYAKLGAALPDTPLLAFDERSAQLTRSKRLVGRHVLTPRQGVAVLINAFNFPGWGFAEKAACALLAGMPVLNKPATSTALPAHRMAEILVDSGTMPEGAFSFVCGGVGDMLDHLNWQDVVAFTGSAATGLKIRSHERVLQENIPVNIEADSLNAAVLGKDLTRDSEAFELFLREVGNDMVQKAGQKCTAIRRILVPEAQLSDVRTALIEELQRYKTGNPSLREVKVGPLASKQQLQSVHAGIAQLMAEGEAVYGDGERGTLTGVEGTSGYFVSPTLLLANAITSDAPVHTLEVFGPVASIIPYDGSAESATRLLGYGKGSLVSSIYSDDFDFVRTLSIEASAFLGRIHIGSSKVAEHSLGPGTVLPMLMHGGPGRAGGGQELGGISGLYFYMQRTAIQGFAPWLDML